MKDLFVDCDRDTILVKAESVGPTCHMGERACFFARLDDQGFAGEATTQEAWGGILGRRAAHDLPAAGSSAAGLLYDQTI